MTISRTYDDLVSAARKRRELQLPQEYRLPKDRLPGKEELVVTGFARSSGLFTDQELSITDSDVAQLLTSVSKGVWSAEQVIRAFCKRAAYAHQITNCMTEMFFDQALERAKFLDDYYKTHGKVIGPLHGLPVSIKDHHQIKGTTVTIGFSAWSTEVCREDSAIITLLLDLGAVLYCKTTVPVAMMMPDTDSHLFGPTVNPNNMSHSAGGSSGGEAALISFGGSAIGIGSDIGGSIRIPAHYNGLYALKPTASRFPVAGNISGLRGQHTIKSVVGPLSRDLESIEAFSKILFNASPNSYDPSCVPVPWREPQLAEKLVIGVIRSDNYVQPTPAVVRALETTVQALKRQGHEVIEWEPYRHDFLDGALDRVFVADGGKFVSASRQGEPLFPYMEPYGRAKEIGCSELWDLSYEIQAVEREYFKRWNESGSLSKSGRTMDAILAPAAPVSSHPAHHFTYVGYTSVFNALDYPSVAIPVLKSDASVDGKPEHTPLSEKDSKVWDAYDPEVYDNGCVGLQVVARRFEDEKAIAVAKVVASSLDAA